MLTLTQRLSGRIGRRRPSAWLTVPAGLIGAATLLPVAYLLIRAAQADEAVWRLLAGAGTLTVLLNTVALTAAVTAGTIMLAVPAAWLTVRTDLPGARVWSVLVALPLVVPSYIAGMVVATVFGPAGWARQAAASLGLGRLPDIYGFPGAWITLTLISYPYVLLSVRAGLRGLDSSLLEAARALGDSGWRTWFRVILPQLRPWIGAGALLVALYVLSDFGAVSMMQFRSFTTAIYLQYQGAFNRAYAAALSLVLVVLSACILLLEARRGRGRYHRVGLGVGKGPRPLALGRWRGVALAYCAALVGLGVIVPVAVVGYWFLVGVPHGEPLAVALAPAVNSFYVSLLGAGFTVAAALPPAILAARHAGRLAAVAAQVTYVSYALPGLVLALSLVFFAARYVPAVYQTLGLLVFAYVLHFLPQAVGALRSALLQVSPSQEEVARTLGRTPRQVLWSVTLPLVRPGVVAAAALVFLTTMKELPATLLLSPIGFETLATRMWSAATEGFFARAATPALVLLALSSLSIWILLRQEPRTLP